VRDELTSFDVFEDAAVATTPRPHQRRLTRLIASLCSVAGLVLLANAATPGVLTSLSTLELFGIVVLAIFPTLTLVLLRFEGQEQPLVQGVSPEQCTQSRSTTHDAHDRPIRIHTRIVSETVSDPGLFEQAS
tara:strand:- start:145 stop:540 length:396 start_codon:yes stop_codon:yes gene_type:complete